MDQRTDGKIDEAARATARARREQYHRELKPSGILQELLVDEVARAGERLRRAGEREESSDLDPASERQREQAERSLYRALAELRRQVKAEAKGKKEAALASKIVEVTARPAEDRRPSPRPAPGAPCKGARALKKARAALDRFARDLDVGGERAARSMVAAPAIAVGDVGRCRSA